MCTTFVGLISQNLKTITFTCKEVTQVFYYVRSVRFLCDIFLLKHNLEALVCQNKGCAHKRDKSIKFMYVKILSIKLSPCLVYFQCSYIIMKTVWSVKICAVSLKRIITF